MILQFFQQTADCISRKFLYIHYLHNMAKSSPGSLKTVTGGHAPGIQGLHLTTSQVSHLLHSMLQLYYLREQLRDLLLVSEELLVLLRQLIGK